MLTSAQGHIHKTTISPCHSPPSTLASTLFLHPTPLSLSRKTGKHLLSSASSANKWHSTRRTDCIRLPLLLSVDLSRAPLPSFLRLLSQNSESKTGTKIADRPEFLHQIDFFRRQPQQQPKKKTCYIWQRCRFKLWTCALWRSIA